MSKGYGRRLIAASVLLAGAAILLVMIALTPTRAAVKFQTPSTPANIEACQACHGINGVSKNPNIPNLAGQKPSYLVAQLKAFKNKDRKNDLMAVIAGQLSDADMQTLATYWSTQPATPAEAGGRSGPAIPSRMTFPTNFPAGFTLYDTATEDGTMSKRYANAVAIAAARAGQTLPEGSIILVVNHEAKNDASGAMVAGAIKSFTGMESRAGWGDSIPLLVRNGNWDYALFNADKVRNDGLNQVQCLACHKPAAADSYVFTLKALRETAARPAG